MEPENPTRCDELRRLVQSKIAKGRLPTLRLGEVVASYGGNDLCEVCDRQIGYHQVLYEVELSGWPMLRFHLACHAAWQMEVTLCRR